MNKIYEAPQSDLTADVEIGQKKANFNLFSWDGRIGRVRFILQLQSMLAMSLLISIMVVTVGVDVYTKFAMIEISNSKATVCWALVLVPSSLFSLVFCCRRRLQDLNWPSWLGLSSIVFCLGIAPPWFGFDISDYKPIITGLVLMATVFLIVLCLWPSKPEPNVFGDAAPKNSWQQLWYLVPTVFCLMLVRLVGK